MNVPLPTHIKAAATAARTAKTDMDRLGESVGNMFQDITRDALNGTLSLKSFGDYAARLVGELFKSESFQNGASSIFSSITSDIGSVFSGIFGGGHDRPDQDEPGPIEGSGPPVHPGPLAVRSAI